MAEAGSRPAKKYLLVLAEEPGGAWRPLQGQLEIQGGKVIAGKIPVARVTEWREAVASARVFLEAHFAHVGAPLVPVAAPEDGKAGGGA